MMENGLLETRRRSRRRARDQVDLGSKFNMEAPRLFKIRRTRGEP
jgi:hypothetical protein